MKIKIKDAENELKKFMKDRKYLIWYVKNPEDLNVESVVEHTLNYGDWEDVQTLIKILGVKRTAKVFRKQTVGKRINYRPEVVHYFKLYFNKYAKNA